MINIKLKDGSIKTYESEMTVIEIAKDISEGLARVACAGMVNDEIVDLRYKITKDCDVSILTFDSEEGKKAFRHSATHILAQAVKRLFPSTKLAIGPAIDGGFYYDFDKQDSFSADEIKQIEVEMKKIVKEDLPIERFELERDEAIAFMEERDENFKVQLIEDLPVDAKLSFYKHGEFTDLCAGPHLMSTKYVKAFKLTQVAGAYWRGNEKNKMLSRIYGTAFTKKSDLDAHIEKMEDAKKRDHNKLGRELKFFTTSDVIGQGLPLLMPNGARVIQLLQRFVEDEEEKRGYVLTKTPLMAKSDLYKMSGHWDHYKDGMFVLGDESKNEEVMALRPMTCPFQFTIYNADQKSYRDLPIRYGETSTLFRNESSGEMHGLMRVRQFTISEGHLVVTPEQLEEEFKDVINLINYVMKTLGIENDITYRFSKWDPKNKDKYINNPEAWAETESKMKDILDHLGINYKTAIGEAAFYGPKLDLQFKNVHGKEDTIITVQIDFALPDRFDMTYIDKDGVKKRPYVIHRTSIGCYERTLAMLIEKYAGAFPTWLAPLQVKVLPISEKYHDYAEKVVAKLKESRIRSSADFRAEKIGYKIREARNERAPFLLIVGEKEAELNEVSVRSRKNGDEGATSLDSFISRIKEEIETKLL
ncbi:threonine--tRNA ligase [Clostridium sp. CM028]|uniref:threonine--tRNA ligase n=1 Tax=Clostridium TaxID=1485 RepID=UPI0013EEB09D|nr:MULTISPECIES: threonine--tRNA ligase [Clostridium]MBW9145168.1 threonine--tRNA ligase [Clostridium sp. CM027]MBW9148408.1 threonine--tRNA ligase [Clostridium sp. CM028]MBZ9609442.1 threonine--tRNA ligase [Clostridium estertheticum]UVE40303.1 threonine--tRNA ligase [Clostridium sp. CM027]WLC60982.1 threonine--tRNA ligase [Clostridium sp. CM028]